LISDALKTAQRERARSQGGKSQQQVVDGFFPYVPPAPARTRSRRGPALVIGTAVVALLAVTAWLAIPRQEKPRKAAVPPIILPPPVTVTQTPARVDTVPVAGKSASSATQSVATPQVAATSTQPVGTAQRAKEPAALPRSAAATPTRQIEPAPATTAETVERHEPTIEAPRREAAPRIDYEAQATVLFNAGDLAGARDKFQLATRYSPTARAWTNYGVTLQRLGDRVGAAAAYQSAIGMDANYLEAWLYQGRLAAEVGDVARAVPLFQRARAINPRNADVNVELARLEYEAKNWTEARRFAEDAVRADPTNIRGHWYIGASSDQLKDSEGAVRGYSSYLQYVGDARDQAVFVGWARTRLAELRGKP
jgi:Flp pilus assembly protein TadD